MSISGQIRLLPDPGGVDPDPDPDLLDEEKKADPTLEKNPKSSVLLQEKYDFRDISNLKNNWNLNPGHYL